MPTYGEYTQFQGALEPAMQDVAAQLLSGGETAAEREALARQQDIGLQRMRERAWGGGGAMPSGALAAQEGRYLGDIALQSALQARQRQLAGLQYGLPLTQYQAGQYWLPQEMAFQREQWERSQDQPPWWQGILGDVASTAGEYLLPVAGRALSNWWQTRQAGAPPYTGELPAYRPTYLYG